MKFFIGILLLYIILVGLSSLIYILIKKEIDIQEWKIKLRHIVKIFAIGYGLIFIFLYVAYLISVNFLNL
jgi:hypothetical protein